MTTDPRYTIVSPVYRTEAVCVKGGKIRPEHRRDGTGSKYRFRWCKKLERR